MSANKTLARVGVAAFALGLVAGPQTIGVAAADSSDTGSTSVSAGHSSAKGSGATRSARAAKSGAASAASTSSQTAATAQAADPVAAPERASTAVAPDAAAPSAARRASAAPAASVVTQVPPSATAVLISGAPAAAAVAAPPLDPKSTVATPYGQLGQWMINSQNQIADWLGKPQPVSNTTGAATPCPCTPKTILEGINIVLVDTASTDPTQAERNLNAWMRQGGFGSSVLSSTGYQGQLGASTYGQQPTGPSVTAALGAAFRDSFFLFANSHGRVFGPYPNPDGPGYVWTASLSTENWKITDPLTHGYQSFQEARNKLATGMVNGGATDLGTVNLDNTYNVGGYSTGDANGYATVLGLNTVLKTATSPRGATKGLPG